MRSTHPKTIFRLGTRGSLLARTQSQSIADMLESQNPDVLVEVVRIRTSGDQIKDRPLHEFGGKGLFTRELESALLSGEVDFVVHSMKDVPVTMPLIDQSRLAIAAIPAREDPRDVLMLAQPNGKSDDVWPTAGARVGTGSLRRRAQILASRPDLNVLPIRGNIDTRLSRLFAGDFDAIVLAMAGLHRCGLYDRSFAIPLEPDTMLPAAAQGALAIQCRRDDARVRPVLEKLDDPQTALCVTLERGVVAALDGDCHSPIAALATIDGDEIQLCAAVAARDGMPPVIHASASSSLEVPNAALDEVIASLRAGGAFEMLSPHHEVIHVSTV